MECSIVCFSVSRQQIHILVALLQNHYTQLCYPHATNRSTRCRLQSITRHSRMLMLNRIGPYLKTLEVQPLDKENCNCKYDNFYTTVSSKLLLRCFTRQLKKLSRLGPKCQIPTAKSLCSV